MFRAHIQARCSDVTMPTKRSLLLGTLHTDVIRRGVRVFSSESEDEGRGFELKGRHKNCINLIYTYV